VQSVTLNRDSNCLAIEQLNCVRQPVSTPRHGLDVDAPHAEPFDAFPNRCPAHSQHLRQPFA
jgi:hypothetical protein